MSIFHTPAASPAVIPGTLIVLAMTLGYSSMDRVVSSRRHAATTKSLCGGPTGLPVAMRKNAPQTRISREGRCSARTFVKVEMSGISNDAQLFLLSNLPLDAKLLL
jgi:hypothetical protein